MADQLLWEANDLPGPACVLSSRRLAGCRGVPGKHTRHPGKVRLLLQFWWRGKYYRYLNSVLDPQILPLAEVVRLYARRLDIKLAFQALKEVPNLHQLWSTRPVPT